MTLIKKQRKQTILKNKNQNPYPQKNLWKMLNMKFSQEGFYKQIKILD